MRKAIPLVILVASLGCEKGDQGPVGQLEYETQWYDFFRDGDRIEQVPTDELPDFLDRSEEHACGYLTSQALSNLENTLAAADPEGDYPVEDCGFSDSPSGALHLDGFSNSPFSCDSFCCHPDLEVLGDMYQLVLQDLAGEPLELDGEPLVAINLDRSCRIVN